MFKLALLNERWWFFVLLTIQRKIEKKTNSWLIILCNFLVAWIRFMGTILFNQTGIRFNFIHDNEFYMMWIANFVTYGSIFTQTKIFCFIGAIFRYANSFWLFPYSWTGFYLIDEREYNFEFLNTYNKFREIIIFCIECVLKTL